MSLSLGELVGYIELKDKGFDAGLKAADKGLDRLASQTTNATRDIEQTVDRAFEQVARSIADGVDPNAALADLNRLLAGFTSDMDRLETEARTGGQNAGQGVSDGFRSGLADLETEARAGAERAVQAIETAASSLDNDLREKGKKGGIALGDGLESGLGDAHGIGRHAGTDVADGIGDGGGPKIKGIGGDWLGSLKGLGWAAAGATLGSLVMDGIQTAIERQDLFAKLAAQVGAFGKEAERLGDIAGQVYADAFGDSMGDVTEAVGAVRSTLGNLDDGKLKGLTEDALTLAGTFDTDVNDAVASVGILLKTKLVKDATEAFDTITKALQKVPAATRGDLLEASDEYSVFFQGLGFNAEEAFGVLVKAAAGGKIQLDKAGDALKEFKIRGVDMSTASVAAYKTLGLNAKDMATKLLAGGDTAKIAFQKILDGILKIKDPVKQSNTAVALFGTQFEDLGNIDALAALRPMTNALGNVEGAAKKASDTIGSTASSSATSWSRSWEGALSVAGEKALELIQHFLPAPAELEKQWNDVTGWFSGTVGPWFAKTWESVKTTTAEKWGQIKTAVSTKASEVVDWLKGLPGKIMPALAGGWESIKSTAVIKWGELKSGVVAKATELIAWLKGLPSKIISGLGNLASLLYNAGVQIIQGLINGIKAMAARAIEAARGVVQSAIDGAKHLLGIASPSRVFHEIGQHTIEGFVRGIEASKQLAAMAAQRAAAAVKAAFGVKGDLADQLAEWVSKSNAHLAKLVAEREALVQRMLKAAERLAGKATAAAKAGASSAAKTAASKAAAAAKKAAGAASGRSGKAGYVEPSGSSGSTAQSDRAEHGKDPGGSGVTINMHGTTVREHADIGRLGAQFGFEFTKRG